MVMESIGVALGGLNAAKDLIQAFDGVKTAAATNDIKLTMQRHLLDAYAGMMTAQEQIATLMRAKADLEQRLVEFEDWEAEARKYELADTGNGTLAYRRTELVPSAEPEHWLCPRCYQDRKKSILQPEILAAARVHLLRCYRCNAEIITRGMRQEPVSRGRR